MTYVDGFIMVVPKNNLDAYKAMAQTASVVWKEYGALSYRECVGDDLNAEFGVSFPKLTGVSDEETVVFAWIEYESKEKRDEINAKVMEDPRIKESCDPENMPFDCQRMTYGGFQTIISA